MTGRVLFIAALLVSSFAHAQEGAIPRGAAALPVARIELSGAIAGRVCRDADFDGVCTASDPGIAGVRLVLETGHAVTTDANGRYHFAAVDPRVLLSIRPLDAAQVNVPGFAPGRHRLKVDRRTLPAGAVLSPGAATLEVPQAGIVLQHFPVRIGRAPPTPPTLGYEGAAPEVKLEADRLLFEFAGAASPGAQVQIGADTRMEEAAVDAAGRFRAMVSLVEGENRLQLKIRSADGTLQLFAQDVDLVRRPSGLLVVPREPRLLATLELPEDEAVTGRSALPITAPPGTRIRAAAAEIVIDASGRAELPVELETGHTELPVTITAPGVAPVITQLSLDASPQPFAVGLIDVELGYLTGTRSWVLTGQGAGHVEHRMGAFLLEGELSLQEPDFSSLRRDGALALVRARRPERFQRWLDPESHPWVWGDDSVAAFANPAEGRVRLELEHERFGGVALGTHRASFETLTIGQYHRALFGPSVELRAPINEDVAVRVEGFASPGLSDPTRPLAQVPAHEEFRATGGSLFYLSRTPVVEGAERLRIEVRDSSTGLPIRARVLERGRDYELDALSGRLLLAQPLSFASGAMAVTSEPIGALREQVLVVDYASVAFSADARAVAGGEAEARLGPARLHAGGVQERLSSDRYQLLRAGGAVELAGLTLSVEGASSRGQSIAASSLGISDSGGLSFFRPSAVEARSGEAIIARLRGSPLNAGGTVDAVFQHRTRGFSDDAHLDQATIRQFSLRAQQPIGPVAIGVEASQQRLPDPGAPFGESILNSRIFGGSVALERETWTARIEGRDVTLEPEGVRASGRSSVGLAGRYQLLSELALLASHKQVVARRGDGVGSFDDTFSSIGGELQVGNSRIGARAGWGPALGPLGSLDVSHRRGEETYYGGYGIDADGPDVATPRAVTGARVDHLDGSSAYVEDLSGTSYDAVRLSRAVGVGQKFGQSVSVGARYERGQVFRFHAPEGLTRSAAGVHASLLYENVLLYGKAEERREERSGADVLQRLVLASAEWRVLEALSLGGRFQFGDTQGGDIRVGRFVEGGAGLTWRPGPFIGVARYAITAEAPLEETGATPLRKREIVSLMPAVRMGRFGVAAGGHGGWTTFAGETSRVFSASLRPSVQVVGGLEVAAEVAARTSAPDGGELTAVRGEVAYAFESQARLGVGYTVFGFSGIGVVDEGRSDRVYLRAELAY